MNVATLDLLLVVKTVKIEKNKMNGYSKNQIDEIAEREAKAIYKYKQYNNIKTTGCVSRVGQRNPEYKTAEFKLFGNNI